MKNKLSMTWIIFFTCSFFISLNCSNFPGQNSSNSSDTQAPVAELLNTPSAITNSTEINITVTGSELATYRYNLDSAGWTEDIDVAETIIASALADGVHTLEVIGCDLAGNRQSEENATECDWTVDTIGPNGTFMINNGNSITHLYWVGLNINVNGADEMRFQNEGGDWSAWEAYTPIKKWLISDQISHKHVFAEFRDKANNILFYNDEITFDNVITASDGQSGHRFSSKGSISLSNDGSTALIGAESNAGGSAYVFKWDGTETKLTADDGGSQFGLGLGISGDGNCAIIGSPGTNSAYFYKWNNIDWVETKILLQNSAISFVGIEAKSSFDGNSFILGSLSNTAVLKKWNGSSWSETEIPPFDGAASGNYGYSVAISADASAVIVGNCVSASVYYYRWNNTSWSGTKFSKSGGDYGTSVTISADGNAFAVGTNNNNAFHYRWVNNSWVETSLTSSGGSYFSWEISVSGNGNVVAIGDISHNAVYIFQYNGTGWTETKIISSITTIGSGISISGDGTTVITGADTYLTNKGAAFIYRWNGASWINY